MTFHLYADAESIEILRSSRSKALLLGSDFGYGNFGDLLQHMGAAARIRAAGHPVVSVLTLDALSRYVDVLTLRKGYAVDALVFVTTAPIEEGQAQRLGLRRVETVANVSLVQLYGGGFLNNVWGDFVLSVAEFFLQRLPNAQYLISGQQVSEGYEARVEAHVAKFRPLLVGLRDQDSLRRMAESGVKGEFSFDDAVEPLLGLHEVVELRRGDGAFVHLNTSDYTGNSDALGEMRGHLDLLRNTLSAKGRVVLLQAFQDAREEVVDTLETTKRLETAFPFVDVETVLLVSAIMQRGERRVFQGEFGYSSSYHVTLWLQLLGIPCWLRGSNRYYEQKRAALGIEGSFEEFLASMRTPDHGENLHLRSKWLEKLDGVLGSISPVSNGIQWDAASLAVPVRSLNFKGEPRLSERLGEAWRGNEELRREMISLHGRLDVSLQSEEQLVGRLRAVTDQISQLGADNHELQHKLASALDRLQAHSERLTAVGDEARQYREQSLALSVAYEEVAARERDVSQQLQLIHNSRVWRWTRPLRALNRFRVTGRFDAAGSVGAYRALQLIGYKAPIPQQWRSALGRLIGRLRRR